MIANGFEQCHVVLAFGVSVDVRVASVDIAVAYGPGVARVTRVVEGRDATVIYGRYEGLSPAELEKLSAYPAVLRLADATELQSTWYQHTTDEAGASFEFRFARVASQMATLSFSLKAVSSGGAAPPSDPVSDSLGKYAGQWFAIELPLPGRSFVPCESHHKRLERRSFPGAALSV